MCGAARTLVVCVGGAFREDAPPAHLQPATRSVRARQLQLQRLLGLAHESHTAALPVSSAGSRPDRRVRQVPTKAETCLVQPRRGEGAIRARGQGRKRGRAAKAAKTGKAEQRELTHAK